MASTFPIGTGEQNLTTQRAGEGCRQERVEPGAGTQLVAQVEAARTEVLPIMAPTG